MKIVFLGTSEFAVPSLKKLNSTYGITAVITKRDKPQGRRLVSAPSPVKAAAQELGLPVSSVEGLPADKAAEALSGYGADIFIVIAYGQILPAKILSLPNMGSVGLHASLLPKYRGPSPINWAIINGETETGVTVFRLNERMDAGEIVSQCQVEILPDDNTQTLSGKLAAAGAELLSGSVGDIASGKAVFTEQDAKEATVTGKLKKEEGRIDWSQPAAAVHNRIRGLYGWPGAFSVLSGKTLKIWSSGLPGTAEVKPSGPGRIAAIDKDGITVSCGEGSVIIIELQAEGGRRMRASEYALGHNVRTGDSFVK
ncbi:MAG: methionyl-tRNA formyltransferase [Candidatus Omnitrophota bacterium]